MTEEEFNNLPAEERSRILSSHKPKENNIVPIKFTLNRKYDALLISILCDLMPTLSKYHKTNFIRECLYAGLQNLVEQKTSEQTCYNYLVSHYINRNRDEEKNYHQIFSAAFEADLDIYNLDESEEPDSVSTTSSEADTASLETVSDSLSIPTSAQEPEKLLSADVSDPDDEILDLNNNPTF